MSNNRVFRYLLLLEGGLVCVGIINFVAVSSFLDRFAWEWVLQTVCAGYSFGYVWWTYKNLKRIRELKAAFDSWNSGVKTYEEIYPILVKHTPKGGVLCQTKSASTSPRK